MTPGNFFVIPPIRKWGKMSDFTPGQKAAIHAAVILMKERMLLDSSPQEWIEQAEAQLELELKIIEGMSRLAPSRLLALDYIANGIGEVESVSMPTMP